MVEIWLDPYAVYSELSISATVTPSSAALSRSICRVTCGLLRYRSLPTSCSPGSWRIFASMMLEYL